MIILFVRKKNDLRVNNYRFFIWTIIIEFTYVSNKFGEIISYILSIISLYSSENITKISNYLHIDS